MTDHLATHLTPRHLRAARALLAWSQSDLAKAAEVATSTVADFERGQRTPVANNAQAIRTALEKAGIGFLPTGAVVGPVPSMAGPTHRTGMPVRWVSAEGLGAWANSTDGPVSLPTLVANLIRATHGWSVRLRFPSDEGTRFAGWDGLTDAETSSNYVPSGESGWEIGAQRSNISQKADEDFAKRTLDPGRLDPACSAFIFVTPRHWPKKDEWAKARQAESSWREVRAYDADDLVHWIEQAPTVGLWLATRLDKRPPGTRELDEVWEEWSRATQPTLTEELVLTGRDEDAAEVMRWLRSPPSILSLQASTSDEVVAFFHSALSELPDYVAGAYRARSLVATTSAAARALADAPAPMILLLTDPDPGLARRLVDRGHFVLQAYDERPAARGEMKPLARPTRDGIASALIATNIAEPRAQTLARDSARNISVLRRLLPLAPGTMPKWALQPPPPAFLAALMAGSWDESVEGDRAQLSNLSNRPYETLVTELTQYVGKFDDPLQKVGSTWRVASPIDAWFLLARYLTNVDVNRFEAAAHAVLASADPRYEMEPDERWLAPVRGVRREYSGLLRHGLGQVLVLLAIWGNHVSTAPETRQLAEMLVGKLLLHADAKRWWSLSGDFQLLAEASPNAFLEAIEDSLDQEEPQITALFGRDEGGVFGAEHLSDLMWTLECLSWSPDYLPRVTSVLARLDAIDTKPRRYINGPVDSLRRVYCLWSPQTHATLDQRLRALDLIRRKEADTAWKLMLGLLPKGHDTSSPSPTFRWRDYTIDEEEIVTFGLIGRGAAAISDRLLNDVGINAERWSDLLDRLGDLIPEPEAALARLEAAEPRFTDQSNRSLLWERSRSILHHHRQFPDVDWSLPAAVLDRLENVYERLAPSDALSRLVWLFQHSVQMPRPSAEGWEAQQHEVDAARQRSALTLYVEGGMTAVLSLARMTDSAALIGKAICDSGLPVSEIDTLLEVGLRSNESRERDFARGMIFCLFGERKEPWAEALLDRAKSWGDAALLTILHALPSSAWTWDRAAEFGGEVETSYWRQTSVYWMVDDIESMARAIRMLISVECAYKSLPLAARGDKFELSSELLLQVLQAAVDQSDEAAKTSQATMFQYHFSEILQILDKRKDVDEHAVAALEWRYLQVLDGSRRPAKILLKALSQQPSLFLDLLRAFYRASEESGVLEPEPTDPERARVIAMQAYRLMEAWDRIPGTCEDGSIDGAALEGWIKEARRLAKEAGRGEVADGRIGKVLSASPKGADGNWPAEPVREAIDLFRSKPMIDGFIVGKMNRRGVTTRMPRDGGDLERKEVAKFRAWAKVIAYDHPHTAKALDKLADNYEREALSHDNDVERLDW